MDLSLSLSHKPATYALQGSGVCKDVVNPETMTHIFNTAIRPVLTYGLQCVYQNKAALEVTEKLQYKLLKAALGLKRYCKNTPLLAGADPGGGKGAKKPHTQKKNDQNRTTTKQDTG